MRRGPEAAPGAMELVLVRAAAHLRAQGFTSFSLGLAPLAGVGGAEHGLVGKGLDYLFRNLDGVYRYRSLQRFKDKFAPRWEDRYLLYPGPLALPSVLLALARVHVTVRPNIA
jgi:phosphatidylglycerol lysyltransferase